MYPVIIICVISIVLCFLPVILLLKKEFGTINKNQAIRSKGIKTTAVIKEIKLGGKMTGNEIVPGVTLSVMVENEKGEFYSAKIYDTIAVTDMPQFQPGAKIDVVYDPADPTKVAMLTGSGYSYEDVAACLVRYLSVTNNQSKAYVVLNVELDVRKLKNTLSDIQKRQLISDIAEGRLSDVVEIAKILEGQ
ncbi:MAG: hypothetical protein FWG14_01585 [Peptococcaceae bacterium]|nr:hypothetical protein [Peptococcaceae bacterium]